jgi:hypothetical protein
MVRVLKVDLKGAGDTLGSYSLSITSSHLEKAINDTLIKEGLADHAVACVLSNHSNPYNIRIVVNI